MLAVFVGVGVSVDRAVIAHQRNNNTPESQIRLAAAMAGLFSGGAAATVAGLAVLLVKKKS